MCVCELVRTDIWGQFYIFKLISVDTPAVGTSPVIKPMPINFLLIVNVKHIDMKSLFAKTDKSIFVKLRYLRLKLLKYKENNKKFSDTFDHNFKNNP